jgi:hypothetical protein
VIKDVIGFVVTAQLRPLSSIAATALHSSRATANLPRPTTQHAEDTGGLHLPAGKQQLANSSLTPTTHQQCFIIRCPPAQAWVPWCINRWRFRHIPGQSRTNVFAEPLTNC